VPPGWTDWQGRVAGAGGYYNHTINDNGQLVRYGESEEDYQTDVLADRAVETIAEAAQRQPFFLSIGTIAPHVPAMPAPRHEGVFDNEPLPKSPSYNEEDMSDKPSFIRNRPLISPEQEQELTASHRGRLGSLLAVDDLVERVVDALADAGVLNNTVLIFTSDNGWFLGEHRITRGKILAYEEAARMPLLIRGGGFPKGATVDQVVGNIDLAPTIIDLADAAPGRVMDGRSILPLGSDPNFGNARDLLIETLRYQAVRNESFLYVEHDTGEQELYDMRPGSANYDPYQLESRHADSAYSQIMAELANKLNELRTCSGESCEVQ
jgi:N-acetylglucosamine-6-sulfatase